MGCTAPSIRAPDSREIQTCMGGDVKLQLSVFIAAFRLVFKEMLNLLYVSVFL